MSFPRGRAERNAPLAGERLESRIAPTVVSWAADADGFWDVPGNWSTGTVPGPGDDVVIDRPTVVTVTHRSGTDAVRSVTGRDRLTVDNRSSLAVAGSVDVTGGVSLALATLSQAHLSAGTRVVIGSGTLDRVTADGILDLAGQPPQGQQRVVSVTGGLTLNGQLLLGADDANGSAVAVFVGTQTLDGTGTVVVGQAGGAFSPSQYSGATLTVGPGITVRGGTASIGTDNATVVNEGTLLTSGIAPGGFANALALHNFVNRGTVRAEAGAGLRPDGTWTNFGTIQVVGGGELFLAGAYRNAGVIEAVDSTTTFYSDFTLPALGVFRRSGGAVNLFRGTLDNRGTTLALDDTTGSWNLSGGTVLGGTITTAGSARLTAHPVTAMSTLDGVTLNGFLDMTSGSGQQLAVAHGLTLNGSIRLAPGGGGNGMIRFIDSSTLDGTGTVLIDGQPYDNNVRPFFGPNPGTTLHIGPHVAVRGGAEYSNGFGGGAVETEAVIDAGTDGLSFPGGVTVNGAGALANDPAGTLVLNNDLTGNTTNVGSFALRGRTLLPNDGNAANPVRLEAMSADRGPTPAGYNHNFAYGTLEVAAGRTLRLVDRSDNTPGSGPEALYVESLIVRVGGTVDLNGLTVYARAVQIDGTVLGGAVRQIPDSGPIAFGEATGGAIGLVGELDEWTFFGRRGRAVTAVVNPGGGTPTPPAPPLLWAEARLLGPGGAVLADLGGTQAGQLVTLAGVGLPADGTYRLQVRAPAGHTDSTGHYLVDGGGSS